MFVTLLSEDGRVQWHKPALGAGVRAVASTADHAFVATEFSGGVRYDNIQLQTHGHTGAFIVKLDALGKAEWGRVLSTPDLTRMEDIVATPDGGALVSLGVFWGNPSGPLAIKVEGGKDAVLVKLSQGGDISWTRTFGWKGYDEASKVLTSSDGAVLAGTRWPSKDTSSVARIDGQSQGWVTRVAADGQTIWTTSLGQPTGYLTVEQAAHGPNQSIVVMGRYRFTNRIAARVLGSQQGFGGYTAALDRDGHVMWVRAEREHELMAGTPLYPNPSCLAVDDQGRVVVSGPRGIAVQSDDDVNWLVRFDDDSVHHISACAIDGHELYLSGSAEPNLELGGKRLEGPLRPPPVASNLPVYSRAFVASVGLSP